MLVTKLVDVSVVQQTMQQQQVLAPAPMMAPMPPVGPPAAYAQPAPYGAQPSLPPALASQITDPQQVRTVPVLLIVSLFLTHHFTGGADQSGPELITTTNRCTGARPARNCYGFESATDGRFVNWRCHVKDSGELALGVVVFFFQSHA